MTLAYRVAIIGVLTAVPAVASEVDLFRQLSSEYADCFAYYNLAKQCAPHEASEDELSRLQSEIDSSGDMTLSTGRTAGLSDEAVGTRYVEALQSLISDDRHWRRLREILRSQAKARGRLPRVAGASGRANQGDHRKP
jgi:hypothetical protein